MTISLLYLWIGIAIVCFLVDVLTSTYLFSSFSLGAITSAILAYFNVPPSYQYLTFIIISLIAFVLGYPLAKKLKHSIPDTPTLQEGYVGQVITLEEDLQEKSSLKVNGLYWTVIIDGELLKAGDKAEIVRTDGNKLVLKKFESKEPIL